MKKYSLIIAFVFGLILNINAQNKKDGTPDMRYSVNKQLYSNSSASTYNTGTNNSVRYQSSYTKSNGTYVAPHYKTQINTTNWDNYSTKSNSNPYNNKTGSRAKDYSSEANNYGSGKIIYTGLDGGQYYYNSNFNKVYVPKRQ